MTSSVPEGAERRLYLRAQANRVRSQRKLNVKCRHTLHITGGRLPRNTVEESS